MFWIWLILFIVTLPITLPCLAFLVGLVIGIVLLLLGLLSMIFCAGIIMLCYYVKCVFYLFEK